MGDAPVAAAGPLPTSMAEIAARVATLSPTADIAGVVARLQTIEHEHDGFFDPQGPGATVRAQRGPRPDGVSCFNGMYLCVTEAVRDAVGGFESPHFIPRLDVVFAEFYFEACQAISDGSWCSRSWAPLFKARDDLHVLPLQFAVAGMNAHINNDLAYALVQTWRELGISPDEDTPEHRDYVKVNAILSAVEDQLKASLLDPFIADVDHLLGRVDDWLAMWSIGAARADAWDRARHMLRHPDAGYDDLHDRAIGFAGRLLLMPLLH